VPRVARERADGSVEERLERLEQLVHSLMSLQQPKPEYRNELKPGAPAATGPWERSMKMELFAPKGPAAGMNTPLDPKEAEKIKEQAKQLAVRAEEQAKRATAEAGTLKTEQKRQLKQGSQMQLEGLRRQREALEREREKLDRQIEELRRHQELLDEQFEEESANDLQAEASVSADEEAGALRRR
jgi:DNA repair exonuclease SbcCD ATPase subunit